MTFNSDRPEKHPTQAFGRGMHICLGQFLAIANVEEGIHLIAQRIANPRLAGDPDQPEHLQEQGNNDRDEQQQRRQPLQ